MHQKKYRYKFSKEELKSLIYDFNNIPELKIPSTPKRVMIWDETLRDGEQTPGVSLSKEDKMEIARELDDIGVAKFAAGFPAVSKNEADAVKSIVHMGLAKSTVLAIARPKISDIDACIDSDLEEIVLFMPISDLMMKILHETPESELEKIQKAFDYAREHGLKFNWVSEDCTRARPEHILDVFQLAIDNRAESIIIGDTVGILQPQSTAYLMNLIKDNLKMPDVSNPIPIGIHTHNDFGLAVANTIMAVYHGATLPHVCINGYGERAGNAAFEEVVVNLERMNIDTGIKMEKLTAISKLTEEKFGLPISIHKPIVGDNAFSHESGLHINAIISHPMSYEPINPAKVGQKRKLYLGKFSGTGSIVNALATKLKMADLELPDRIIAQILQEVKSKGEELTQQDKKQIFKQIKELMQKLRKGISDTEFFKIVQRYASEYLKGTWADPQENG